MKSRKNLIFLCVRCLFIWHTQQPGLSLESDECYCPPRDVGSGELEVRHREELWVTGGKRTCRLRVEDGSACTLRTTSTLHSEEAPVWHQNCGSVWVVWDRDWFDGAHVHARPQQKTPDCLQQAEWVNTTLDVGSSCLVVILSITFVSQQKSKAFRHFQHCAELQAVYVERRRLRHMWLREWGMLRTGAHFAGIVYFICGLEWCKRMSSRLKIKPIVTALRGKSLYKTQQAFTNISLGFVSFC